MSCPPASIGVLDLQGGVQEHLDHLARIGVDAVRVKTDRDFSRVSGLIIPGGESTCLRRLLRIFDLERPLLDAYDSGMKIWGTCAGAILLATRLRGEDPVLGVIDIEVSRNAFGSQLESFQAEAVIPEVASTPIPLTFIRAPKILSVGDGVRVLLEMDGYVAAAESEGVIVTAFHPELTPCLAFHRYFAAKCGVVTELRGAEHVDSGWDRTSWMRDAALPGGPPLSVPRS